MEKIVEIIKKKKDGIENIVRVTVERKSYGWFGHSQIVRLYWNGDLVTQDKDGTQVYSSYDTIMKILCITQRDLGILPGDYREWTKEEVEGVIDAICSL